jgi:hypothetical protein
VHERGGGERAGQRERAADADRPLLRVRDARASDSAKTAPSARETIAW